MYQTIWVINTSNIKKKLYGLVLSTPSEYYELKSNVIEKLNVLIAEYVYKIAFYLLTEGVLPDKTTLKINGTYFKPSWSGQAATTFSLDASNEINKIITKCVDIIFPASQFDIAYLQLNKIYKTLETN